MAVNNMIFWWNLNNFAQIRLEIITWRFLRSLITKLKMKKLRI